MANTTGAPKILSQKALKPHGNNLSLQKKKPFWTFGLPIITKLFIS